MPRAATTTDVFNAIGEPCRREILDVLASGEHAVNELVVRLDLAQPQVSKHLRVLREVGLVEVREAGRHRLYSLNVQALAPVRDWMQNFERLWIARFEALDAVLEELQQLEEVDDGGQDE